MTAVRNENTPITTAVLLAAGIGSRLQPITDDAPKCLTDVNGTTILKRLIGNLSELGFRRLVLVVGYLEGHIRDFLASSAHGMTVECISSPKYRTTNNIYSLWVAREAIHEPFLLVESDLVFDTAVLKGMQQPDKMAVSRILPWMKGTTVAVDHSQRVTGFHFGGHHSAPDELTYKTVNMYSFSLPSWRRVAKRLEHYVSTGRVNVFYEMVFAEMVAEGSLSFQAVHFDNERWYEVDTLDDLRQAEQMFPPGRDTHAVGV